jgi:hypothetical protein
MVFTLKSMEAFFGFSKDISDETIDSFQNVLSGHRKEIQAIIRSYTFQP